MPVNSNLVVAFFLISSILFGGSECLDVSGPCRILPVEGQFNATEYMGTWYEIKRYENADQPNGDCVTARYTLNASVMEVTVENTMKLLPSQQTLVARGRAVLASATSGEAKLKVRFDSTPANVPDSDYWVLGTNYQHYAVVWSCRPNGDDSSESAWVLSRNPVLDQSAETLVDSIVSTYLQPESLRVTKQGEEFCSNASLVKVSSVLVIVALAMLKKV
ncbi:lazarillo protein-like [Ochlerotatus camptorhynchus]|uniref:lazarillo protein-like n=1 Tax=Ochlerotatus camptorhynchus TaxID=644619 RepID=UPI0031CE3F5D